MSEQQAPQQHQHIVTSPETIEFVLRSYLESVYLPAVKDELLRFLIEHDHKLQTMFFVSQVVGREVGGEGGTFHIKPATDKMISDIKTYFEPKGNNGVTATVIQKI